MKSGYNDFFKKAKENRKQGRPLKTKSSSQKKFQIKSSQQPTDAEIHLRNMLINSKKKKKKLELPSLQLLFILLLGIGVAGLGAYEPGLIDDLLNAVEINTFSSVSAQQQPKNGKNAPQTKAKNGEKTAAQPTGENKKEGEDLKDWTNKEMSYFGKLNDRKQQLDNREAELVKLEEELHKQKVEIEKRIGELQKIRDQISGILNEKVKVDQEKVNKLVEFYSNMKPQQAAKTLSSINEDLAVEVLGKMKKKNAADILNLLEPKKAQILSEKFAGYKRR